MLTGGGDLLPHTGTARLLTDVVRSAAGFIEATCLVPETHPLVVGGRAPCFLGLELGAQAAAALEALEHGWTGVHERLAARRQREFGAKWRFNRALRALVTSPRAVAAAALGARVAPGVLRALITHAGDCDLPATCAA